MISQSSDIAEMVDLKTKNGQFTWNNKRMNQFQVATRLDIFLISKSIIMKGLTLDCNIPPGGDLITGQCNWKQDSKPHQRIDPSDLRNSGSKTRLSRKESTSGGGRRNQSKG